MRRRCTRWCFAVLALLGAFYLTLLIPDSPPPVAPAAAGEPFAWDRDEYWSQLETGFQQARSVGCADLTGSIDVGFAVMDSLLSGLESGSFAPDAPVFGEIENGFFRLAMLVATCPERLHNFVNTFGRLRLAVKNQSVNWDMNSRPARDCLYRLLYGGRTAVEEVILQSPSEVVPETAMEINEPSVTPSEVIHGVRIHSGDILVSRGGAPTSALIARGNDYPGNFSHAALVHVDENTRQISIIEAHIERGVAIASVEDYLKDTKLRIMVLRLRSDLPAVRTDPMLPHTVAKFALRRAQAEHIPYDFAMDPQEHSKLFCSEVVSEAYESEGVNLWLGLSHISSSGVKNWLSAFGVENFTTQEPSDLEYDPQLRVVAEWRDYETLLKDRLDNAVMDVMLEGAEKGSRLDYDWHLLPSTRVLKAYSMVLNLFGGVGPIPEGMSATAALRNKWFSAEHETITQRLSVLVRQFENQKGYFPPYWEMIELAGQVHSGKGITE